VFDYEQVLVVADSHVLAGESYVVPEHLSTEVLITYPVETDRLDIYTRFLTPANVVPKRHKVIETTDIMLQMVASGRGVAALPRWLAEDYADRMPLVPLRLGKKGVAKQIFLGTREADDAIDYLAAFVALAREADWEQPGSGASAIGCRLRGGHFRGCSMAASASFGSNDEGALRRAVHRARD
jgi:LysR family transcriptional regulator for metE and metH